MEPQKINAIHESRHEDENDSIILPNMAEKDEEDPCLKYTTLLKHNLETMGTCKVHVETNERLGFLNDTESETSSNVFGEQYTGDTGIELSQLTATPSTDVTYVQLRGRLQSLQEVEDEQV